MQSHAIRYWARGRWLVSAAMLLAVAAGGCDHRAYLDGDSRLDPVEGMSPGLYVPGPQYVHVGEKLNIQFLCRPAIDDYAVFQFPNGQSALLDADPDRANYRTSIAFAQPSPPEGFDVVGTGYRIRGRQDMRMIAGKIERTLSVGGDPADQVVATARLHLIVYQSRVQIENLGGPDVKPDWEKSTLRIIRSTVTEPGPGQQSAEVKLEAPGNAGGFTVNDADGDGRYTLTYFPKADQVNRGGTTWAELKMVDSTGKMHTVRDEFATP